MNELNGAAAGDFVTALGGIYEHSDWVPQKVVTQRPFADREQLRSALRSAVELASAEEKLILIRAHPDLAGKLARAGALTAESTREQAGLGLDRLTDAAYEQFSNLNQAYQERFGFPFIICARLTTQSGVVDAFTQRLKNSREAEIQEALVQIHEIARLRLEDLVED